jgi:potassium efflux system protein
MFQVDSAGGQGQAPTVSTLWRKIRIALGCGLGWGFALLPCHAADLAAQPEAETPGSTEAAAKPDAERGKLEQSLQEARDALAALNGLGETGTLPEGIDPADLDERRRTLEQWVLAINRSLKDLVVIDESRKALEAARKRDSEWSGFKKAPPYSLLMIDDLINEREASKSNLESAESSLANYERMLASILEEAKAAEEVGARALTAVQDATPENAPAAKWRLETTRANSRLLATRANQFQSMVASQRDRIATASADLKLLDRQLAIAKANASFTDEDLTKLARISKERKQVIRKELEGLAKRLKTAIATRDQAKAAIDATGSASPADNDSELAKYRLEVAEGGVETVHSLIEGLEGLLQLEEVGMKAYQDRRTLTDARSLQDRVKALDALGVPREHLWAWVNVLDDEMSRTTSDLTKLEARAATVTSADPRFRLLSEQRANTAERLAMLQRLSQAVETQRRLVKRWVLEYSPEEKPAGLWQRMADAGAAARDGVGKIWNLEVMSFEEKVEVAGETITGRKQVTLGVLLRAAMFFLIGYWLASLIARRIQRTLVARGRIAEAQARTLRNWAMIAIGVCLALGTLAVMRIPLTMFAFLGGALAIGLGIGTQTLIKNFISGIIVLAERKVRVGDLIEVDGITGTIIEINTRSSVLRSADDVETLIPNSSLLDGRVTNRMLSNNQMRHSLRVVVPCGAAPSDIIALLTESAARHGLVLKQPAPFAVFDDLGEKSHGFTLFFWVDLSNPNQPMIVASDLRLIIEKRLSETGISPTV